MVINPANVAAAEVTATVSDACGITARRVRITMRDGRMVDGYKVSWNVAGGRRVGVYTDDAETATGYHNAAVARIGRGV